MPVKFYKKIRKWGGSKGIILPAPILAALNLKPGDEVTIHIDNSHIIIKKR